MTLLLNHKKYKKIVDNFQDSVKVDTQHMLRKINISKVGQPNPTFDDFKVDDVVNFHLIDMGGPGRILAKRKKHEDVPESQNVLVVKFGGGSHWSGRGQRSYHSPSIYVLVLNPDNTTYSCLVTWDVSRGKK